MKAFLLGAGVSSRVGHADLVEVSQQRCNKAVGGQIFLLFALAYVLQRVVAPELVPLAFGRLKFE